MSGSTASVSIPMKLRVLKMPTVKRSYEEAARLAENEGWSFEQYLDHLLELELTGRRQGRVQRLLKKSGLLSDKTLGTLDLSRLPTKVARQVPALCTGGFVSRGENVLAFGNPGTGKTHIASAIGHELVHKGLAVLFIPTYRLVQRLLAAKRELALEPLMRQLDRFDLVILDDIGYVQQDREEMEVLFTFLSERYERRSVMITSNLVFSQWDRIFKDPLTTAAAIDRLVHHATILEITGKSFRTEAAKARNQEPAKSKVEA